MNESYPPSWKRVELMVSPGGEFHAIGGDREPGDGDMPCPGMERLKARFEKIEGEREAFHKTCGELLQATIEGDGSVTWSKVKCEECAKLRTRLVEVEGERNTVVCEDTGRMARGGECPEHHGDACLYDVSAMREAVNQNTSLRVQLREALKQESRGCPCTLTKPCMDVCSCANMAHSGGCLRCCRYGSEEQRKARAEIIADAEKAARAVTDWDAGFLQSLILDPQQRTISAADAEKFWQDIAALKDSLKE